MLIFPAFLNLGHISGHISRFGMPEVLDVLEEPSFGGEASLAGRTFELDVWSVIPWGSCRRVRLYLCLGIFRDDVLLCCLFCSLFLRLPNLRLLA